MTAFLFGIAALIVVWALLSWGRTAKPLDILRTAKWIALGVAGVVLLVVLVTRNIYLIWGLPAAALPWITRLRWLRTMWKTLRGPSPGRRSEIACGFFDIHLDHDSGAMDGRIKKGTFQGARLSELSLEEGRRLRREVVRSGDDRSRELLEVYLDRRHGAAWRDAQEEPKREAPRGRTEDMTREEALCLLGLRGGATPDEIKAAHRRLMKQVHPDAGGSAWLAAKVNRAKDVLLG